ncbi:MAG: hypothetical protein AAF587_16625 [Bacteroidota bacterium]
MPPPPPPPQDQDHVHEQKQQQGHGRSNAEQFGQEFADSETSKSLTPPPLQLSSSTLTPAPLEEEGEEQEEVQESSFAEELPPPPPPQNRTQSAHLSPVQQKAMPSPAMMPTKVVQRWIWPFNSGGGAKGSKTTGNSANKGGGGATKGGGSTAKPLKQVTQKGTRKGTNFDSTVNIPGPLPGVGDMVAQLNIKVNFLDATMKNIRKHAIFDKKHFKKFSQQIKDIQKKDPASLTWDKAGKDKFRKDYQQSIDDSWSSDASKWVYKLDEKEYEKYQVNQKIKLNFTDKSPHETINTIKMAPGMRRLRSYRGSEDLFDSRDVSVNQKRNLGITHLAEQVGEFATSSADLNADVQADITNFVTRANAIMTQHKTATPTPNWRVFVRGRASSPGKKKSNKKLSQSRADNVATDLKTKLKGVSYTIRPDGETNTDKDSKYQRVELILFDANRQNVEQNVAAHETGHMFGLGDEYADETTKGALKKSHGDEADDTSQAIRDAGMGEDEVLEHRINQHNDSIMNAGSKVMRGHYSFFLIELKQIATDAKTGAQVNWKVVKG